MIPRTFTAATLWRTGTAGHFRRPQMHHRPAAVTYQARFLNIHEHLSHEILARHGIAVPRGKVALSPQEAKAAALALMSPATPLSLDHQSGTSQHADIIASAASPRGPINDFVIKAQVLAGGRGKGVFNTGFRGGVHIATSPEQVEELSSKILGNRLITKQTGAEGKLVNRVYIQERVYARRELYFAILLDRASGGPVMIGSQRGGMSIEDVAKESPEEIFTEIVDTKVGVTQEQVNRLVKKMGFTGRFADMAREQVQRLYEVFINYDATLLEVNPMIETPDGLVLCADCKLNFDDNAGFRQKKIFDLRDVTQEDPREIEASKYGLNYIGLDGNIGCIVNGAGLAMATMDIIKLKGGSPANFLDVGGGATQEQVTEALKILNNDQQVQAILVNIFGGIMRCDIIALGIINAAKTVNLRVPLVVRLKGTRVDEGVRLMEDSGLRILNANDLEDAAAKAVRVAHILNLAKEIDVKVNFELPL